MRTALYLPTLLLCLGCVSCAPLPVVEVTAVPGPPPTRESVTEYNAALGTDFVRLVIDRRSGRAHLNILGSEGAPRPINARHLPATFRLPGGEVREAAFEPANGPRKGSWPSSRYWLRRSWLRGSGDIKLTVDVPLAGKRYRVTFECLESSGGQTGPQP